MAVIISERVDSDTDLDADTEWFFKRNVLLTDALMRNSDGTTSPGPGDSGAGGGLQYFGKPDEAEGLLDKSHTAAFNDLAGLPIEAVTTG